jgi:hypothetical protein
MALQFGVIVAAMRLTGWTSSDGLVTMHIAAFALAFSDWL